MSNPVLSRAAAGLLRAMVARSGAPRNEILLTDVRSVEWHSLTFDGERHEIAMRLIGPDSPRHAALMLSGIEEHEFVIPGVTVVDIAVVGQSRDTGESSVRIAIEALTIDGA
jgi:hypothetical protein